MTDNNIQQTNSKYWMADGINDVLGGDPYALAATKRAISNFVDIVAGNGVKVKYSSGEQSYTDGKSVVISSNIKTSSDFDVTVGLALHEASHVLLSNFDILKNLYQTVDRFYDSNTFSTNGKRAGLSVDETWSYLQSILNYIEDRRIDNFIYKTSPGYRNYYHAMYNKFFNNKDIDTALRKGVYFKDENTESYMFRIINLHSNYADLDALKSLRQIYNTIDFNNISRLKSTHDALRVAVDVCNIIFESCPDKAFLEKPKYVSMPSDSLTSGDDTGNSTDENLDIPESSNDDTYADNNKDSDKKSNDSDDTDDDNAADDDNSKESKADDSNESGDENGDDDNASDSNGSGSQPEDQKLKRLRNALNRQTNFTNGNVKKSRISKKMQEAVGTIEESGIDIKNVSFNGFKIPTIVVKNVTESLLISGVCPLSSKVDVENKPMSVAVEHGITIGTTLARKLKLRAEDKTTVYSRQNAGKIDKRLLSSAGYGYDHLFYTSETDRYKNVNIHLSIDASGSMSTMEYGMFSKFKKIEQGKWYEAIVLASAIAKAADSISNLNVQISFRTTTRYNNLEAPYVMLAYDSRKDKISKLRKIFSSLTPAGTTPESLCYEAIQNHFINSSSETDSYFVTITDGAPYFVFKGANDRFQYTGYHAAEHIKSTVKKFEGLGINTLSYFVSDGDSLSGLTERIFNASYGSAGKILNVRKINNIIRELNGLLLKK